jgi:hypothetical protein
MTASGMKTGSAKGLCNRQDTQRCTSGRIGMDGNSVMISRMKRRKIMSDYLTDTNVGNTDYIRRDDAIIEMMDNNIDHAQGTDGREVVQILSDIPAADVMQVVHSQWKYKCGEIRCPECGNRIHRIDLSGWLNFCPNCGAKMDGKECEA